MQVDLKERIFSDSTDFDGFKKKGSERLSKQGLPGKKTERWMKFDISPIKEYSYRTTEKPSKTAMQSQFEPLGFFCEKVEIHNGYPTIISEKLVASTDSNRLLGQAGDDKGVYFYNLNSTLLEEPLYLKIGHEMDHKNIHISHIFTGDKVAQIANPRIIISIDEGVSVNLIETFEGQSQNAIFENAVTEISLGKNSNMEHLVLEQGGKEFTLFNHLYVHQKEGSSYFNRNVNTNLGISRNEYYVTFLERDCYCETGSLILGREESLHNSDITIFHEGQKGTSRNRGRIISGGVSQSVIRGFAYIRKGAQGSDGEQQFKSILLNDQVQSNMEPHLEIWADDVKCSHGATVGKLDQQQLFYLQTRGFSLEEARQILLRAFASRIIDSVKNEKMREYTTNWLLPILDGMYE